MKFGASDKPLALNEPDPAGLTQFPTVIGVVPAVNISGVKAGSMVLDGATLADTYFGKATNWNDDKSKTQSSLNLRDQTISMRRWGACP
jgi:phosphate transport system substrate-binding protein